jgi:hypothetical protein
MEKKKKYLGKLREGFKKLKLELFYILTLSLFFGRSKFIQQGIKVEGMGFEPTNP